MLYLYRERVVAVRLGKTNPVLLSAIILVCQAGKTCKLWEWAMGMGYGNRREHRTERTGLSFGHDQQQEEEKSQRSGKSRRGRGGAEDTREE